MSNLTYRQRLRLENAKRAKPFVFGDRFKNDIDTNDYGYARKHHIKRKYRTW
jgi:hypothetical protein